MDKGTIIMKGQVSFICSSDMQDEETLLFLLEVFKSHMNARFDVLGYNENLNPDKRGAYERGKVTAIKEDSYHHRTLKNEDKIPFYLHTKDIRISTLLDDLMIDVNMIGNYANGELDGLVIDVIKHVTTFDSHHPEINIIHSSSKFEFDGVGGYHLKTVNLYTIPIQTTVDSLNSFTDVFCFSTDSKNSLKPFVLLLEHLIKEDHYDILNDSELRLATLLVNSITYDLTSPYKDISIDTLGRIIIAQTDIKLALGIRVAIDTFKEIAPLLNRSLMTTGNLE